MAGTHNYILHVISIFFASKREYCEVKVLRYPHRIDFRIKSVSSGSKIGHADLVFYSFFQLNISRPSLGGLNSTKERRMDW